MKEVGNRLSICDKNSYLDDDGYIGAAEEQSEGQQLVAPHTSGTQSVPITHPSIISQSSD